MANPIASMSESEVGYPSLGRAFTVFIGKTAVQGYYARNCWGGKRDDASSFLEVIAVYSTKAIFPTMEDKAKVQTMKYMRDLYRAIGVGTHQLADCLFWELDNPETVGKKAKQLEEKEVAEKTKKSEAGPVR